MTKGFYRLTPIWSSAFLSEHATNEASDTVQVHNQSHTFGPCEEEKPWKTKAKLAEASNKKA